MLIITVLKESIIGLLLGYVKKHALCLFFEATHSLTILYYGFTIISITVTSEHLELLF